MNQIILVDSYCGLSDYTFEVTVSGRRLNMSEVKQLGLVDDDAIRRHKQSSYSQEWFEINPGDRIAIRVGEDEIEELEFEIPTTPLTIIPQKLDDTFKIDLLSWLKEYCVRVK